MMEAARTSEMLVNFYQTTRCYNPEDSNLHTHRRENLKSFQVLHQRKQKRAFSMWMKVVCFTVNFQRDLSLQKVKHAKTGKYRKNGLLFCCAAMHRGRGLKPLIIGNAAHPRALTMNNVK
jgi:hypothetical protein